MKTILITGATGLVGTALTQKLKSKAYEVRTLSRNKSAEHFHWNPEKMEMDESVFENLDAIIHLAGSPISKKWTQAYRQELYASRIHSTHLLYEYAVKTKANIKTFITASGTNYYGTHTTTKVFHEEDEHTPDFLGQLCYEWEEAAQSFRNFGSRVCALRTSAVLSPKSGMLKELLPFAKLNLVSPLGNGKQIVPWIHIDDLVNLYCYLLENDHLEGAYNAVADEIINNREFTQKFMASINKKILLPPTPGFALKLLFGEMSGLLLKGSAISNQKIKSTGFQFQFPNLEDALNDLMA